jgi:putative membrane protein
MRDKPRVRPYEVDADQSRLSYLPGDEPPPDHVGKGPAPMERSVAEANFLDEEAESPVPVAPGRAASKFLTAGTTFLVFFALFTIGFLAYESVRAVLDALAWWAPTGILLGLLLVGVVVTGFVAIAREFRGIWLQKRSLGAIESARREADLLVQSRGHDRGFAFAARVIQLYETRADMAEPIQAFRQAANSSLRDHEVVARLSSHVLQHLDEQAHTAIGRALRDTAFISLASPNGLVDSLITLWRELKMLREVASIYGLTPGLVQQWALLRRVVSIAATSGMANQAGNMAVQSFGGGIVGHLSANMADSLYTALRTARLGMYAMETCRPVTFLPEERRGMWTLLSKAANSVLTLLAASGGQG